LTNKQNNTPKKTKSIWLDQKRGFICSKKGGGSKKLEEKNSSRSVNRGERPQVSKTASKDWRDAESLIGNL